jgi:hypothetical protein
VNRELIQRALDALENADRDCEVDTDYTLVDDLRAELQKPEPVSIGRVAVINGVLTNRWDQIDLPVGNYELLAVRLDDE